MTLRPWIAVLLATLAAAPVAAQQAPPRQASPAGPPAPNQPPPTPARAPAARPAATPEELPPEQIAWAPLPDDLARVLEAKAAGYARRALKFTCRETIRDDRYENGEASRETSREYEYLLITDPDAPEGFRAVRSKPGAKPLSSVTFDLGLPEPYLWSAVFDPRIRSTLRFYVGRWHTTPWKLAIPIHWVSSAPVLTRDRVTEWSGSIEVEYGTGNVVKVVARPSLQDERLAAELDRWMTSFRFMGFSTASPPIGQELTVYYDAEFDGFTYPSRVEIVTFRQTGPATRETVSKRTIEYSNYRFFGTKVEDQIPPLKWHTPVGLVPQKR